MSSAYRSRAVFPTLPEETWAEIFSYLSDLDDRKSFRSTCRHLYRACNRSRFQMDEEMVFRGDYYSNTAILSLSNSPRKILNVKLTQAHLAGDSGDLILEFFRAKGPNVYSLTLDKCKIGPRVLRDIIEYCSNLQSISLIYADVISENTFINFVSLVNDGIVRRDVTSFALIQDGCLTCVRKTTLTNRRFLRIFDIFPNIKNLIMIVVVGEGFDRFSTISADVTSDVEFTFSSIHYQISKMRQQLETLTLHIYNFKGVEDSVPILNELSRVPIENLKELSLKYIESQRAIFDLDLVLKFKHLTHFELASSSAKVHNHLDKMVPLTSHVSVRDEERTRTTELTELWNAYAP
ncbi:hypothetical protein V9T40_005858 [Parthenolecanium corni]|uniref:F-box domain-containing protein n=1 Tax=Parthenolecanium corni TaxID=536013 RepID=A0AAN9TTL7_9HEMI